ncbi:MAG: carbon-nitrogen hydrolase family protein [Anaerolineae bacterium]
MRIALVPLKIKPKSPAENLRRLKARLAAIADIQPDLIVLPECALTGYVYEKGDFDQFAEPLSGPTVSALERLARRYRTYICFGMIEQAGAQVYDSGVVLNREGQIVLVQRKLSEKPPFQTGSRAEVAETELGKMALLICGDLFHADAVMQLPDDLDWVLVPMARAFAGQSPDKGRCESEGRAEYLNAVRATGKMAFLVNALDEGIEEPSFGGAMVANGNGDLLAESPHGSDEVLLYELWCGLTPAAADSGYAARESGRDLQSE